MPGYLEGYYSYHAGFKAKAPSGYDYNYRQAWLQGHVDAANGY